MSQGFVTGPSEASGTAIGGVGSNTYTIDGATNAGFNRQLSTSPNADMIQEMRVETSNFDASNGPWARQPDLHDDARRHERDAGNGQLPVLDEQAERAQRAAETDVQRCRARGVQGRPLAQLRVHARRTAPHPEARRRPRQGVLLRQLLIRQRLDSREKPGEQHGAGEREASAGRFLRHAAVAEPEPVHHLRPADGAPRSGESESRDPYAVSEQRHSARSDFQSGRHVQEQAVRALRGRGAEGESELRRAGTAADQATTSAAPSPASP